MRLSLTDAFARFGARPRNSQRSVSAIAEDGAMVLNCAPAFFVRPARGVLRYEDRLTRDSAYPLGTALLSEHLTLARTGDLPVRLVIAHAAEAVGGKSSRSFHVRPDLVGKVTEFDGDHYIVDFTRLPVPQSPYESGKRRKS
jgi:hypothetical protein